jgi:prepilin-type N-terminal cleavage/methylation domain-containing protein
MNSVHQNNGFSLVEVLVAIAIFSLLSLTATTLLISIQRSQQKSVAISVVETEANFALYQITQSIRNASGVTSPIPLATSTSLTLALAALPAENPTKLSLSTTTIVQVKGVSAAASLTGASVKVTNLVFKNLTVTGTKGSVQVVMTIAYANPANAAEKNFVRTYYTTVSLR